MTFTYNGTSIAEIKVFGLTGHKGLGISQLWFSMEFHVESYAPKGVTVKDLRIRVRVARAMGGNPMLLGTAEPETAWEFDTAPGANPRRLLFQLSLSDGQIFELERLRGGHGLQFHLHIAGLAHGQYGTWPQHADLTFDANASAWAKVLSELGGEEQLIISISLPVIDPTSPFRSAVERIRKAHRALLDGHYDSVVADCRLAIESAQSSSGDRELAEEVFRKLQKQADGGWRKLSKLERELLIGHVARHYAHLAHHVDDAGQPEIYSRDDALFSLSVAAAVVSSCARRLYV